MTAQKGSAFLLKISDGAPTPSYETVAGLRTTQMSINGDTVVVTTKKRKLEETEVVEERKRPTQPADAYARLQALSSSSSNNKGRAGSPAKQGGKAGSGAILQNTVSPLLTDVSIDRSLCCYKGQVSSIALG